jgi:hypothetical protein
MREEERSEDPAVYGTVILKRMFEKWGGWLDWINLAKDRDRWWAILYAVMNLPVL